VCVRARARGGHLRAYLPPGFGSTAPTAATYACRRRGGSGAHQSARGHPQTKVKEFFELHTHTCVSKRVGQRGRGVREGEGAIAGAAMRDIPRSPPPHGTAARPKCAQPRPPRTAGETSACRPRCRHPRFSSPNGAWNRGASMASSLWGSGAPAIDPAARRSSRTKAAARPPAQCTHASSRRPWPPDRDQERDKL
jgi:hypothetical protein